MLQLKQIRINAGLSVPELSRRSGVPRRTIQDIELRGDCMMSNAAKLAEALSVSLNDLWHPTKRDG